MACCKGQQHYRRAARCGAERQQVFGGRACSVHPGSWTANCACMRRDPGCKAHKRTLCHTSRNSSTHKRTNLPEVGAQQLRRHGRGKQQAAGFGRRQAVRPGRLRRQPSVLLWVGRRREGWAGRRGLEIRQGAGPEAGARREWQRAAGWGGGGTGGERRRLGLLTCSRSSRLFSVSTGIRLTSEPAGGGCGGFERPAGGAQRWPRSRAEGPTLLPSHSCRSKRSPVGCGLAGHSQTPARLPASRGHSGRAAWGL